MFAEILDYRGGTGESKTFDAEQGRMQIEIKDEGESKKYELIQIIM